MALESAALLRRVPFLAGLDEHEIDSLAAQLIREEFAAGETIPAGIGQMAGGIGQLAGGRASGGLRFLAAGRVEMAPAGGNGPSAVGKGPSPAGYTLSRGDHWGELELFHPADRPWTARALEAVMLYRWPRPQLTEFLRTHPVVLRRLRFLAGTRRLAAAARLNWLAEDEALVAVARRHPFYLVQSLAPPAVLALAGLALGLGVAGRGVLFLGLGGLALLAAAAWGAWNAIDWTNDYFILTSRRGVWLEKVIGLYDSRRETPLSMVLSVDLSTDALGRWLGYGDVGIRTYTGLLSFRGVAEPATMAALVEESWRRVQERDEDKDRAEISTALRRALRQETSADDAALESLPPAGSSAKMAPSAPVRSAGLDHWNFQIRFEEKGVITYRKHWAVLLNALAAPSMLILLFVGLLGAQIGGLVVGPPPETVIVATLVVLTPLAAWWTYRYVDWANDIYQVTPDQIRDIYKKPLGREVRKVAPLENILSTEVDRRGLNGLLLNYGDVVTNIGTAQFVFQGVYDPNAVQRDIVRAIEAFLSRKRDAQKQQRQGEMVEWLTTYHEQTGTPTDPPPESP